MDVLRVFISGTQIDLGPERQAVERAIGDIKWEAVRAETYGSQPMPSRAACQEMVERSDIYLGLYGQRYGWVIPADDLSVTEFEFNEARRLGKPMLVYVKDVPPEQIEPRQAAFLKRVEDFDTGFFRRPRFTSTQELGEWVQADLAQLVKRLLAERPPFPPGALPPIWNVPLRRNPNFTGRATLLADLRTALTSGQPAALTQAISGLGGVG
ncbi:MAG: DUF4062 domain-containing protein, partial [Chloroflexi bacterium]|nr:DUF4062 domain-containing protein [Chloroflexota bacterium]